MTLVDPKEFFTSKAEKYARYRWDYAPAAIEAISQAAQVSSRSVVADIGAGTGILSRHFAGRTGRVYAVEPNGEMRLWLERAVGEAENCTILAGSAEATGLPEQSVDLITVAQAIHWFDPAAARREFLRILKPQGWLAVLGNRGADPVLSQAIEALESSVNGINLELAKPFRDRKPMDFYYGSDRFQRMTFSFSFQQNWQAFMGSLASASYMPDEGQAGYDHFEAEARRVFERFSRDGWLETQVETELYLGQPEE